METDLQTFFKRDVFKEIISKATTSKVVQKLATLEEKEQSPTTVFISVVVILKAPSKEHFRQLS